MTKWEVVEALKGSKVAGPGKLVMLMLVDYADVETAFVPPRFSPSLNRLARDCTMSKSTVADYLDRLERAGWLKRERPATADSLARGERTSYQLQIGEAELPASRAKKGGGRPAPEAGPPAGQAGVRQPDTADAGPGAGHVRQPDRGSAGAGQGVVREPDHPGPGAGHKKQPPTGVASPTHSHQDPPGPPTAPPPATADGALPLPEDADETAKAAAKPKRTRRKSTTSAAPEPDAFPITDAMRTWAATKAPDVADLEFHTEQFLNHHAAKGTKFKDWVKAWQTWIRNEQQWGRAPSRASPTRHQPYRDPETNAGYYEEL